MVPKTRLAGPVRPKIAPNLSNRNSFPGAKASRAARIRARTAAHVAARVVAHIRAHVHVTARIRVHVGACVRARARSLPRQAIPPCEASLLRLRTFLRLKTRPPAAKPPAEKVPVRKILAPEILVARVPVTKILATEMRLPAQAALSQMPPPRGLLLRRLLQRLPIHQRLPIQMPSSPVPPGEVLPGQILPARGLPA